MRALMTETRAGQDRDLESKSDISRQQQKPTGGTVVGDISRDEQRRADQSRSTTHTGDEEQLVILSNTVRYKNEGTT